MTLSLAGITTPELCDSFVLCEAELRRGHAPIARAAELLPLQVRPHLRAVGAFVARTDHIADESDPRVRAGAVAEWCSESLRELRQGTSEHPLRRAFVHTVRMWDLDIAVVEELLDTFSRDSAAAPEFATVADQRRYLRGVSGTVTELCTPLLEPMREASSEVASSMSLLGEAFQLMDIFQDFPLDLARGRCYLPREDLARFGLAQPDLQRRRHRRALDELVDLQVARARQVLERGARAVPMVHPSSAPFLRASVLAVRAFLDEVARLKSAVLFHGVTLSTPKTLRSLTRAMSAEAAPILDTAALASRRRPGFWRRRPAERGEGESAVMVVPRHVAVIMDGNRRWAAARGESALEGHIAGKAAAQRLVEAAVELEIPHLSVFAFSTENWGRPQDERDAIIQRVLDGIEQDTPRFQEQGVQVRWCGRQDRFPAEVRTAVEAAEQTTAGNTRMVLTVCADYGGRDDLLAAARTVAAESAAGLLRPEEISEAEFALRFYSPDMPDVDLLIRTSGEQRISNFLLWQCAYAEIVFQPVLWPDYDRGHLMEALVEYSRRQRRFGEDEPARETADPFGVVTVR